MFLNLFILKNGLENVFYIHYNETNNIKTETNILNKIKQILSTNFKYPINDMSFVNEDYIEIGPKKLFKTSWNTNMIDIFKKSNIHCITNIEFSVKYPKNQFPNYDKMIYEIYNDSEETYIPEIKKSYYVPIKNISNFSDKYSLGFDQVDIKFYTKMFYELNRDPTNVELYDLSQSNSEHARHWFFRGKFIKGGTIINESLMDMIKSTKTNNNNGIVSFYDNASVIMGNRIEKLILNKKYEFKEELVHFSYKAETHNFPTSICPFPGAATGVGGRIRDTVCVGRGGEILAGTAGYSVGELFNKLYKKEDYSFVNNSPKLLLIEASNGASDYGNKIGEPIIQGFTRSYRCDLNLYSNPNITKRFEYLKPIMFSGGIGKILHSNIYKNKSQYNNMIGRVGGAAYRIGIGGGSSSSRTQDKKNLKQDFNSVQRGDPEMANKVIKFIRACCSLEENPILSIHDQGSGGMANVSRELAEPNGANILLDKLILGDESLTTLEKWVAEYQEQVSFIFDNKNLQILHNIAKRENVPFVVIGNISNTNYIKVITRDEEIIPVNLPIVENEKKKTFYLEKDINKYKNIIYNDLSYLDLNINKSVFEFYLDKVLSHLSVCSKSFLTNKVDRSVSGLIVQQQCIGPFHLPLSNNSVVSLDFKSNKGLVSAIGEQPIKGIPNSYNSQESNIRKMVRMTVSEMLLNMIWTPIDNITKINSVANWMWASKNPKDANLLREAVKTLVKCVNTLGFSINGGKDSLSMSVDNITETIKSPNTLVLSGYATCISFNHIITPNFKRLNSYILYINLTNKCNLGGTIFEDIYNKNIRLVNKNINGVCDIKDMGKLSTIFNLVQKYIKHNIILSGHDISDGGLITTLTEMCISSNIGMDININNLVIDYIDFFFNENSGIVLEINERHIEYIINDLLKNGIGNIILGKTDKKVNIRYKNKLILDRSIEKLRYQWEKTSYDLEKKQANPICIKEEMKNCYYRTIPKFYIPQELYKIINYPVCINKYKPKIAIINEEGSNGENEMAFCFLEVGFEVHNVNINDLVTNKYNLNEFRGIAFVGGFSFSDVLGAAYGWYFSIINNEKIRNQFVDFYNRKDTFSFGVCNGCQLMSLLGWIPEGITLEHNKSNRFESRYSLVRIEKSNSIMLNNMNGIEFGIWTSHGQGRIVLSKEIREEKKSIFPIKYLDDKNKITEKYPYNPNGSENGNCAAISENGRHFAIMPHPERCILKTQMPWIPENIEDKLNKYTPWILMFRNAYKWCANNKT